MGVLSGKQRHYLRGLAHHLDVVVAVGAAGVSRGVVDELDAALRAHELVKVRVAGEDRIERRRCLERLAAATGSREVQQIGRIGVLYRRGSKPRITLPDPS